MSAQAQEHLLDLLLAGGAAGAAGRPPGPTRPCETDEEPTRLLVGEPREEASGQITFQRNLLVSHLPLEPLVERVEAPRIGVARPREPLRRARHAPLDLRKHRPPHAVPREAFVRVRLVLAPGDSLRFQPGPELGAREREERAHDAVGPAGADAAACAAEAALEVEEDRLGLVVARVPREQGRVHLGRQPEEGAVAQAPGRGFHALSLPPLGGDVHGQEPVRDVEARAKVRAEARVREARLAAQAMGDVERGDGEAARPGPPDGEEEERRGVAPARASHGQRSRPVQEAGFPEVPLEAVGEGDAAHRPHVSAIRGAASGLGPGDGPGDRAPSSLGRLTVHGIDTNVLVRFLTRDDAAQFRRVREFLEARFAEGDPVFVSVIVLCETVWVLRSAYRTPRREVAGALERLLGASGLVIEDRDQVAAAALAYRHGPGDFADYLLGERNRAAGCVSTATLDRRLKSARAFQLV